MKRRKRRFLVVLIPLFLILVVAAFVVGVPLYQKYSYGKEMADLSEHYGVSGEMSAIILQNTQIPEQALIRNDRCYFDLATVEAYLTSGFFYDPAYNGGTLMYTTARETYEVTDGSTSYSVSGVSTDLGYPLTFKENDKLYIAADYLRMFATFTVDIYDRHIQLYNAWGQTHEMRRILKDTWIRERGGIKSPILRAVEEGETVELIEAMEDWSKVKTSDGFIGYIENKRMASADNYTDMAPAAPALPEYTTVRLDTKVDLGFHAIYGLGGNDTLGTAINEAFGMNVIAPSWISLTDANGGFRSFASADYVARAHGNGIKVWVVVDNFNYGNENGIDIDETLLLSDTLRRRKLADDLVKAVLDVGADGLNFDFEGLPSDSSEYFIQFLREVSVLCRLNGICLSTDNYVPYDYNNHYRLDLQGQFVDYVLIMGYDEHYPSGGVAGSVASLPYVQNGLNATIEKVPSQKVINAIPFYTVVWTTQDGVTSGKYLTLVNQADYVTQIGQTPVWDDATGQNYIEWREGTTLYQVWLEDTMSISAKLNVMNTMDLGGVGVWRIGYGTSEAWNLLRLYTYGQ
ncbi:MAG: SH3 domain-containing protein [Lachnospiraceae bacterium]|nr:SH3 domain-containing protein [Lachnospiraceae bacterium]